MPRKVRHQNMNQIRHAAYVLADARNHEFGFEDAEAAAQVFAGAAVGVSAERGRSSRAALEEVARIACRQADQATQHTILEIPI